MFNCLNAETVQQMRALCKKISVAHDLDESIQEELFGHMEDKLLAYLSGDEPLSEQDAFILVREHFGDPATIKALMQKAHPGAVQASFFRRIAAVAVAAWSTQMVRLFLVAPLYKVIVENPVLGTKAWPIIGYSLFDSIFFLAVLGLILFRWQRMMAAGRKPWFLRVRPMTFAYPFVLLAVLWALTVALGTYFMPMLVLQEATPDWFSFAINAGRLIASCMLWLWWCDRHPRRVLALCATLTVWLMYPVLPSAALLPLLLPPDTTASSLWPILGTALLQNSKARFLALSVAIAMHFVLSLVGSAKKLPSAN